MSFKTEFAKALVAGWHGDWQMWKVIKSACVNSGFESKDYAEIDAKVMEELGLRFVPSRLPAQRWIAANMRALNECLWAGRPREICENAAYKGIGGKGQKPAIGARYRVAVRARDKRTDWATCK